MPLAVVAEALEGAALWAYLHCDVRAGDRLLRLASLVEHEGQYEELAGLGYQRVLRHQGKSFGWLIHHDADVRAQRRIAGVSVP